MIYMWKISIQTLMMAGKDDVFFRTYGRYLSSAKSIFQLNANQKTVCTYDDEFQHIIDKSKIRKNISACTSLNNFIDFNGK